MSGWELETLIVSMGKIQLLKVSCSSVGDVTSQAMFDVKIPVKWRVIVEPSEL